MREAVPGMNARVREAARVPPRYAGAVGMIVEALRGPDEGYFVVQVGGSMLRLRREDFELVRERREWEVAE